MKQYRRGEMVHNMKVSTRVEYGLIALTDIVIHYNNGTCVSAPEIAERQKISHKYLEQMLLSLRQAGFIKAQKGLKGGYVMACPPDKIRLADVIDALDNNVLAEMGTDDGNGLRSAINVCFWDKINGSLRRYTTELKLSDFVEQCREKMTDQWDNYVI